MAIIPPTKTARDANLDALSEAVTAWATGPSGEIARLDSEAKFLKAVLQERSSSSVGTGNLRQAAVGAVAEIDNFLGTVIKTGTSDETL